MPTLVTILLLPILVSLGFWQIDRAAQKQELIRLYDEAQKQAALELKTEQAITPLLNYRDVEIHGQYQERFTIFHDNQVHNKQPGYHVIQAVKIADSDYSVLVNRGWVRMGQTRQELPSVKTPAESLSLKGKIKLISEKTFTLGDIKQSNQGWPAVVQWLDTEELSKATGLKLHPFIVLLDANDAHGLVRDWKPVVMQPEKNISYAVQWFSLALVLLIIYIVVNFKEIDKHEPANT